MKVDFDIAYKKTNANEGGWVHEDDDTELETYCGISRKWFPKWGGWPIVDAHKPLHKGQVINDARLIQLKKEFYRSEFWHKLFPTDECDSQELADEVYDMAVNASVETAKKLLKQS